MHLADYMAKRLRLNINPEGDIIAADTDFGALPLKVWDGVTGMELPNLLLGDLILVAYRVVGFLADVLSFPLLALAIIVCVMMLI